jgi:hypothetical protein
MPGRSNYHKEKIKIFNSWEERDFSLPKEGAIF